VLHHAGKPKEGHSDHRTIPRGSSAIFDAAGSLFVMSGDKQAPKLMTQQKCPAEAEGGEVEDFYLAIEDADYDGVAKAGVRVTHATGGQIKAKPSADDVHAVTKDQIRAFLRKNPDVPGKEVLRARMGIMQNRLYGALTEMMAKGEVVNLGTPRAPRLRLAPSVSAG
jgi:hypothetical protein